MRTRRTYDHRIREAIVRSGDPNLYPHLHIPPSTTRTWLKEEARDVVRLNDDFLQLRVRVARLEKQVAVLREVIRLLLAWKGVVGPLLSHQRFETPDKQKLLAAIRKARRVLSLKAGLTILGLRPGRYHAWVNREQQCQLDDRPSCSRRRPGRLSFEEVRKMGDMVLLLAHRHMSIRALALHAQRTKQVFAHPVTWSRLIKERGWRELSARSGRFRLGSGASGTSRIRARLSFRTACESSKARGLLSRWLERVLTSGHEGSFGAAHAQRPHVGGAD